MNTKTSKYLSYILRHKPDSIDIKLDKNGWASIDELISKTTDVELTRSILEIIVETNDKQRFIISNDGLNIRANQGHSIDVDLQLNSIEPPDILFHGTATRFISSIERDGLTKQKRHHIHLLENNAVGTTSRVIAMSRSTGKAVEL